MDTDGAAWFSLAIVLTGVSGTITYLAWKSRGLSALLKGAGVTLFPMALWLTYTLRLATDIGDSVASWATGLVFSPRVWVGVVLGVVGVLLFLLGGRVGPSRATPGAPQDEPAALPRARGRAAKPAIDDDLSEIEAILRERGIS